MVAHFTQKQAEDYCRQQMQVAELLAVSQHLDECEGCRWQIESTINGNAAFFALRSEVLDEAAETTSIHLTSGQAAEYVDKNLSGEEGQTVADHLSRCEQCAFLIADLRAFRNQIEPTVDVDYQPAPISSSTESWWRRTIGSVVAPFRVTPLPAFGGALAILLLAVTGWFIWRTIREREPKEQIAVSPGPSLQPSPPTVAPSPAPSQPEAEVVAQLNDGSGQIALDQQGKLSGADNLPPAYQSMVKKALATQRVEKSSQLNGLSRPPSSLMGSNNQKPEFSVLEPFGNVVLTDRPTFRWMPVEGIASYVVEVYDDQFNLVATSLQITNQSWMAPQSLTRGKVYSWQVKAMKDGQEVTSPRPPAPQAKFRILDQAKANELAKAKRAYASSHLTLGLLYADAGLIREAEQELRLLQRANPDSELARNLLRQVQALRR